MGLHEQTSFQKNEKASQVAAGVWPGTVFLFLKIWNVAFGHILF